MAHLLEHEHTAYDQSARPRAPVRGRGESHVQVIAIVISLAITVVAVALFVRAIRQILAVVRTGQPTLGRTDHKAARWATMLRETLGHTRMLQWSLIGTMHWFVFVGFGFLFLTLVTAFGQLFDATFALPLIGHWVVFEWVTEAIAWLMLVSDHRADHRPADQPAPRYGRRVAAGSSGPGCGRGTSSRP